MSGARFVNYMFQGATAFSADLSGWALPKVTSCTGFGGQSGLTVQRVPPKCQVELG